MHFGNKKTQRKRIISDVEHNYVTSPGGTGYYLDSVFCYLLEHYNDDTLFDYLKHQGLNPDEINDAITMLKSTDLIQENNHD